ncbi:LysR family transcriptional regulator [Sulfitobacter mediterraneus]|uniref:LysR family transcriptional regulator n=1 Tax=Sulfitobacter mediterraneus TaxID=83219 RepID=UPI00193A2F3B|nr:LysR family transcriptional regulator [Sulfitobacter mediterraneus]MBM1556862.1 LysR family transcriptional regulator [Sulfitobacter mediterraneus]MBM1569047.1 LysR family transcriptional regulator [Sulfitobacter mediterraneus]MBM1572474.1 LysR family transcriptional regulator [Sulfitobacter mediterraneus]MBM1576637.1 LysR family transcriptional regulator [Sulfitobacter mediterraneus]MBM1579820.1 LysR family transcriptional regulator [Sulfitobacter mediterraneus]
MQNWDDLRLFLAVAREQSLSGAGKQLRLDPATLGRRVARLEKDLQAALFVKSPQGYALTEAGGQLMERAEAAEQAMRVARAGVSAPSDRLSGQIRIGAPDGCANFLLPQVCAGIVAENPGLDIQIVALPRVFNLSRREADMAIGVSAPTAGRLVVQKITDYRLHLAASAQYLQAHPRITEQADLQSHRLVGYIPDMIFDRELDYLGDLGEARVPLASNSVSVQVHMIQQGGGVGVVHDFSLPFAPGVQKILEHEVSLTRSFYLIRHADDQRNLRLSRFADQLITALRSEVAALEAKA